MIKRIYIFEKNREKTRSEDEEKAKKKIKEERNHSPATTIVRRFVGTSVFDILCAWLIRETKRPNLGTYCRIQFVWTNGKLEISWNANSIQFLRIYDATRRWLRPTDLNITVHYPIPIPTGKRKIVLRGSPYTFIAHNKNTNTHNSPLSTGWLAGCLGWEAAVLDVCYEIFYLLVFFLYFSFILCSLRRHSIG